MNSDIYSKTAQEQSPTVNKFDLIEMISHLIFDDPNKDSAIILNDLFNFFEGHRLAIVQDPSHRLYQEYLKTTIFDTTCRRSLKYLQ